MKTVLILLCISIPFAKDVSKQFDSLRYDIQNARKPQGFLLSPLKLMPLIPMQSDSSRHNIVLHGLRPFNAMRSHDSVITQLKSRIDSLEINQSKILEVVSLQKQRSDDLTDSQSYTLKLIESLTALLGAIATIAGILYKRKK